jgi:excisionase family DNA binding protein
VTDRTITLTEAAERLGVHYMTAYRYVRTGRLPATKAGSTWRVDERDLEAVLARRGDTDAGSPRRGRVDRVGRLESRLLAGDEPGSWAVVEDALAGGVEPAELYLDVVAPAMARIGDGWATGRVSVAEEHRASVVVLRLIGRLGPRFARRGRTRGTVVVGAPPGDQHGVPAAMAADLLRGAGFSVVDLGADCPASSFVDAARSADRLVGVGVSATRSGNQAGISAVVEAVHHALDCPVVVGGQGVPDRAAGAATGADVTTTGALDLIEVFTRLADERRARPDERA